jgi:hypothetical protein
MTEVFFATVLCSSLYIGWLLPLYLFMRLLKYENKK